METRVSSLRAYKGIYCHVSGVPWLIITGSGLHDWIYGTSITITINDCLRLAPFLAGLRGSSRLATDLVLIYESATFGLRTTNAEWTLESELLYNSRFTFSRFVLVPSPLKLTARMFFFQLNSCGNSPYITSSLMGRWVCLLWICLAFRQVYISHIYV
jgi:hypothetical protein